MDYKKMSRKKLLETKTITLKRLQKSKLVIFIIALFLVLIAIFGVDFLGGPINGITGIVVLFMLFGVIFGSPMLGLILLFIVTIIFIKNICNIFKYKKIIKEIDDYLNK